MSLKVESLAIPDVKLVTPPRFGDDRGFFSETYNAQRFKEAGIDADFVQDNHSLSAKRGTVRGLHYQAPPFAQAKLVRVLRGAIIDVAVDARKGSPTYGRWVSARLSAEDGRQIYVPRGFLHGFATLEPDTEIAPDRELDRAPERLEPRPAIAAGRIGRGDPVDLLVAAHREPWCARKHAGSIG